MPTNTTSVKQWGNSMGVRIPKAALKKSNLQPTDVLEVTATNGTITLKKANHKKFSDLAEPILDTTNYSFDRAEANDR